MLPKKAQTMIELAIFGSILIFIIGLIIRQGMSFGYIQHQNLKAMRTALTLSYVYSEGLTVTPGGGRGTSGRNRSSVFIVEDRLTTDALKYGSIDRSPYMNSASGTFSRNLFMPLDTVCPPPECPNNLAPGVPRKLPLHIGETWNLGHFDLFVNGVHIPLTISAFAEISMTDPEGPIVNGVQANHPYYFTKVPNHEQQSDWCIDDGVDCTCIRKPQPENDDEYANPVIVDPDTCDRFEAYRRFDLMRCNEDRGNEPDCLAGKGIFIPQSFQPNFGWQWSVIDALDLQQGHNVDLDKDLKEEIIVHVDTANNKIIYIDQQEGDVDFTIDDHEDRIRPGLLTDTVSIFTKTNDGTYLLINEGRLFTPGEQFIRTASKKDSVDLVQRAFQLTNDTGRFCINGVPNQHPLVWTEDYAVRGTTNRNPVEVCGDCFSDANIDKICFEDNPDPNASGEPPILYIRSRIMDKHGRNWVTNIHDDININFKGQ